MKRILIAFFILVIGISHHSISQKSNQGGRIKIIITDIRNTEGNILVSLYNSPEGFPGEVDTPLINRNQKVTGSTVECEFKDIPFGTYAIAIMHDENSNNEMDTNFIGIPKEGIGVSNNAVRTFGPPRYDDCKFDFRQSELTITIKMHYY